MYVFLLLRLTIKRNFINNFKYIKLIKKQSFKIREAVSITVKLK